MSDSPHLAILASAGTGKTWRLTHRLIALLALKVPPEQVLASTFTRKAAGEILQRLVARLVEASTDDARLAEVNAQLAREPGAPQLDRAGARALLLSVLRRVHRIDVRTLDALFHQLARVHGWELDLPPGWQIASQAEADALQLDAIGRVLRTGDRAALLVLLTALGEGAPRRSIHRELQRLVQEGHRAFRESEAPAWETVGHPPAPPAEELAAARAFFTDLPEPIAKDLAGRKNWPENLAKIRDALEREDWKALLGIGPVKNKLEGDSTFGRVELSGPLGAALDTLVDHAVHTVLQRAATRARAWRSLLQPFDLAFLALQRERRLVRFDDIPRALGLAGVPGADVGHLAFRLDGCPDHVLLDEFQDTSTAQWAVLRPLVLRTLQGPAGTGAPSRSLFFVGDVKQSIFGWRDAEPRLLSDLPGRTGVRAEPLAQSRRSAPSIMRVVNRVLDDLPGNEAFADDEVLSGAAAAWSAGVQEHDTALTSLRGAVRMWELPATKADDAAARALLLARAVAQLVARLASADPQATIGILVRRRAPIPRLILELRHLGVLASGEAGNPLTDSDSVQLVLSLLVLADHPGDRAAAFHVATSPLGPIAGVDFAQRDTWRAAAQRVRRELLVRGFGTWLSDLRDDLLRPGDLPDRERQRLGQLVDLGLAWDARATLRPGDFVGHVRTTPVEEPAASRVRVLTVHAAKGLEFEAVVCPELEYTPPTGRGLMLHRPDPEGPITSVFPFVRRAVAARWEPARALLAAVRSRALSEELSVLYVALTRARRRLDLLVTRGGGRGASFAKILRSALQDPDDPADAEDSRAPRLLYADADPGADADPLLSESHAPRPLPVPAAPVKPADAPPPVAPLQFSWRKGGTGLSMRRRAPSAREGGGRRRAAELLSVGSREARVRGAVAHAWMEQLPWTEDPQPDDAQLLDLARRHLLRAGEPVDERVLTGWLAWWRAAIGRPEAQSVLSRAATAVRMRMPAGARPDLWRERRFLLVDEEAGEAGAESILVPGAFDRVVVFRDAAGKALGAEIVDFKTDAVGTPGAPDEAAVAARVAHYAPQMQAYRRALSQIEGLAPGAIACRLLFLEADLLRDVPVA